MLCFWSFTVLKIFYLSEPVDAFHTSDTVTEGTGESIEVSSALSRESRRAAASAHGGGDGALSPLAPPPRALERVAASRFFFLLLGRAAEVAWSQCHSYTLLKVE